MTKKDLSIFCQLPSLSNRITTLLFSFNFLFKNSCIMETSKSYPAGSSASPDCQYSMPGNEGKGSPMINTLFFSDTANLVAKSLVSDPVSAYRFHTSRVVSSAAPFLSSCRWNYFYIDLIICFTGQSSDGCLC